MGVVLQNHVGVQEQVTGVPTNDIKENLQAGSPMVCDCIFDLFHFSTHKLNLVNFPIKNFQIFRNHIRWKLDISSKIETTENRVTKIINFVNNEFKQRETAEQKANYFDCFSNIDFFSLKFFQEFGWRNSSKADHGFKPGWCSWFSLPNDSCEQVRSKSNKNMDIAFQLWTSAIAGENGKEPDHVLDRFRSDRQGSPYSSTDCKLYYYQIIINSK